MAPAVGEKSKNKPRVSSVRPEHWSHVKAPIHVLISSPSAQVDPTYLPYTYGVLKTYCEQDPVLKNNLRWLKPLYRRQPADVLLDKLDLSTVDVLGLSCYLWNWTLQKTVAERVKQANADCLVVAGGPHCDASESDFFERHPAIDLVVQQEGEEPFRRILRQRLSSSVDWSSIPGVYYPDDRGKSCRTAPPQRLDEREMPGISPYREQSGVYDDIISEVKNRGHDITAMLESNRGCPFRCSYCDWGGLTNSSVRKFPLQRVERDIDWLTSREVESLYLVDANIGRFDRDVEIIRYLCRSKSRTGRPKMFIWNFTKTRLENARMITKLLQDHGLIRGGMSLFLQHTNDRVIEAIHRRNPDSEQVREIITFNRRNNFYNGVWLLLGCPSDTYESWKRCFTDLMEEGVHGGFVVTNFHLLPNAPAAEDSYREKHGLETTTTRNLSRVDINRDTHVPDLGHKKLVTKTNTFDQDDWCRMWIFTYVMRAAHSRGVTRKLALYLHYVEGISFYEFYESMVDELMRDSSTFLGQLYDRMLGAKKAFLAGEDWPLDRTTLKELPDDTYYPKWREWLFTKLVLYRAMVFEEIEAFLVDHYEVDRPRLRNLIDYTKFTLVSPDYSPESGKQLRCYYDWLEYFNRHRSERSRAPVPAFCHYAIDRSSIRGKRSEVPVEWHRKKGKQRVREWFETLVKDPFGKLYPQTTHTPRRVPPDSWWDSVVRDVRRSWRSLTRLRG